jgi:Flp pilus assembly protein TadG
MLAALSVALIALAGIVIDGGVKLRAAENADAIAQEAARAGAGIVNQSTAYSTGTFVVDQSQATAAWPTAACEAPSRRKDGTLSGSRSRLPSRPAFSRSSGLTR